MDRETQGTKSHKARGKDWKLPAGPCGPGSCFPCMLIAGVRRSLISSSLPQQWGISWDVGVGSGASYVSSGLRSYSLELYFQKCFSSMTGIWFLELLSGKHWNEQVDFKKAQTLGLNCSEILAALCGGEYVRILRDFEKWLQCLL